MATSEGRSAAIAAAHAQLVAQGKAVTVRALREAAQVSTEAARRWLADNKARVEPPAPPQDFVATVWPLAFTAAVEEAAEAQQAVLEQAREGEAQALARAEAAERDRDDAQERLAQVEADAQREREALVQERDEVAREAERQRADLVSRCEAVEATLAQVREELAQARQVADRAGQSAAAAQARVETLTTTLAGEQERTRGEQERARQAEQAAHELRGRLEEQVRIAQDRAQTAVEQVAQERAQVEELRRTGQDALQRATRAEAEADTLRAMVALLRPATPAALDSTSPAVDRKPGAGK